MALTLLLCACTPSRRTGEAQDVNLPTFDAPEFVTGPYVIGVTQTEAEIRWVSEGGVPRGRVSIAPVEQPGAVVAKVRARIKPLEGRPERVQRAAVTGLLPGTRHAYTITCGPKTTSGEFVTAPDKPGPFTFASYGDHQHNGWAHRQVANAIAKEKPVLVLDTGDLPDDGGDWDQWLRIFMLPAADLLRTAAFWPVRGNHDRPSEIFRDLFSPAGRKFYYSFDFGNAHFVMVDCFVFEEDRPGMLAWLDRDLAGNQSEWTLVAYHVPTFNVGGHAAKWGWDDVLPLLEKHGVDVVLSGHSHLYERFKPIGEPGKKPIVFIVSGGGGGGLDISASHPLLTGGTGISTYHYCLFMIDGNQLSIQAKQMDGTVIDSLVLVKENGLYQQEIMEQAVSTQQAKDALQDQKGTREELYRRQREAKQLFQR